MTYPLSEDEQRIGAGGFVVILLGGSHLGLAWWLTDGDPLGTPVLALLTFAGAVHLWRHVWLFLDRWKQLRKHSSGLRAEWRAFWDATDVPEYEYPSYSNPAPLGVKALRRVT
jgi:hypothetical protein